MRGPPGAPRHPGGACCIEARPRPEAARNTAAGAARAAKEDPMRLVLCNCPPDAAEGLAERLVTAGLAACVNLLPGVGSIYVWQGALCRERETTLLIKVAAERVEALRVALVAAHPYDCPEVLVLPVAVAESHGPYVDWVRAATAVRVPPDAPAPGEAD